MENKDLLHKMNKLGFPLLEAEENFDVNQTLAEVVKSKNARLLEGFVVLLANAARDKDFSYERVQNYLTEDQDRRLLKELVLLSLGLYKVQDFYLTFANNFHKKLSKKDTDRTEEFRDHLVHNDNFKLMDFTFSAERLRDLFNLYLVNEVEAVKKQTKKQEDFSLEYALSQVFSPKQKELFLKKVKGGDLTKTEREYFSRTVKKKLLALVNPELSRCARLLLE